MLQGKRWAGLFWRAEPLQLAAKSDGLTNSGFVWEEVCVSQELDGLRELAWGHFRSCPGASPGFLHGGSGQAMGPEFLGTGKEEREVSVSQFGGVKGKIGGRPPSKMGQGRCLYPGELGRRSLAPDLLLCCCHLEVCSNFRKSKQPAGWLTGAGGAQLFCLRDFRLLPGANKPTNTIC